MTVDSRIFLPIFNIAMFDQNIAVTARMDKPIVTHRENILRLCVNVVIKRFKILLQKAKIFWEEHPNDD